MANMLPQFDLNSLGQEASRRYSDALREKRQFQEIAQQAGNRFSGALGNKDLSLNPADVFNTYQTFNAAIAPRLNADQDIFQQMLAISQEQGAQANQDRNYNLDVAKSGLQIDPQTGKLVIGGGGQILSKIEDKGARAKAAEYVAFMKDLKDVKNGFFGNGFMSDLGTGQTGPLAQFLGQYGEGGDLRAKIDALSSKIKNKTYGAAISEGELKDANKWLPSSGRQETVNVKRMQAVFESKKNELTSLLRGQGLGDDEINFYMDQMGINDASTKQVSPTVVNGYIIEEIK